jgi:hypothetical protein
MRRGWNARFFAAAILLFSFHQSSRAGIWGELVNLSTGEKITSGSSMRLNMTRYQIIAFRITDYYIRGNDDPHIARLKIYTDKPRYDLPPYVENWVNQTDTFTTKFDTLENIFYIRPVAPNSVGLDSFRIEASLRYGLSPYVRLDAAYFTFYINVTESQFEPAEILPEPQFTAGTVNTVFWVPSAGARLQDVYCFDKANRDNLKKSIQRLYRRTGGDTVQTVFEGLEPGRTYGYFAKSVYGTGNNETTLYTDFSYSTQDNTPPAPIESAQAVLAGTRTVLISWNTVSDDLSGIASYRIYRAEDTGSEVLIDSVAVETLQPPF